MALKAQDECIWTAIRVETTAAAATMALVNPLFLEPGIARGQTMFSAQNSASSQIITQDLG